MDESEHVVAYAAESVPAPACQSDQFSVGGLPRRASRQAPLVSEGPVQGLIIADVSPDRARIFPGRATQGSVRGAHMPGFRGGCPYYPCCLRTEAQWGCAES